MAKKQSNEDKIIAALDAIDKSVRNLRKFGARYDEYIDQAAMRNDDKRARQLIRQKVGVYALAEQLATLKSNLELGVYTTQAVADLGKLPAAISACKGLLSESPNFSKLGANIEKIFKEMQKPVEEISKLNGILDDVLSPSVGSTLTSRLDGANEEENNEQFAAEYAAMMDRIKAKVAADPVAAPSVSSTADLTGDINFDGIISEENKKK